MADENTRVPYGYVGQLIGFVVGLVFWYAVAVPMGAYTLPFWGTFALAVFNAVFWIFLVGFFVAWLIGMLIGRNRDPR